MNLIQTLAYQIEECWIADAQCSLDPAQTDTGDWFLEATVKNKAFVVDWSTRRSGFGLSWTEKFMNEGCDQVLPDIDAVLARIAELVKSA